MSINNDFAHFYYSNKLFSPLLIFLGLRWNTQLTKSNSSAATVYLNLYTYKKGQGFTRSSYLNFVFLYFASSHKRENKTKRIYCPKLQNTELTLKLV